MWGTQPSTNPLSKATKTLEVAGIQRVPLGCPMSRAQVEPKLEPIDHVDLKLGQIDPDGPQIEAVLCACRFKSGPAK